MVATARSRHPGVTIDVGDATSMTHPDASFDAVTIGFCLHHTADAPAVLREAKRVLRPGGRIAYTVWAANDRLEAFGIAFAAVAELVPEQAPAQQAPSIGDAPADHERLLSDNGFVQPTARTLDLTWALTDGAAILDGFSRFLDLADQPRASATRLRNRLDAEVARRAGTDHVAHIPNPAIIASAANHRQLNRTGNCTMGESMHKCLQLFGDFCVLSGQKSPKNVNPVLAAAGSRRADRGPPPSQGLFRQPSSRSARAHRQRPGLRRGMDARSAASRSGLSPAAPPTTVQVRSASHSAGCVSATVQQGWVTPAASPRMCTGTRPACQATSPAFGPTSTRDGIVIDRPFGPGT